MAIKFIGIDRWPRFVADASERAYNPATIAIVNRSRQAIGPVGLTPNAKIAGQRTQTEEVERKRKTALTFVRAGGSATEVDLNKVAQHLASILSASQLEKMRSTGIRIVVARDSITDYLTDLKGIHPRGYPPGVTWDTVPGVSASAKEIVTATHAGPNGERELPGNSQSSSVDVTLHEFGHALNRQIGSGLASDKADFQRAFDKDANTGPLADAYYHQSDASAGGDEAFAESHAEYLCNPTTMKRNYPNLYAYWAKYYGEHQ